MKGSSAIGITPNIVKSYTKGVLKCERKVIAGSRKSEWHMKNFGILLKKQAMYNQYLAHPYCETARALTTLVVNTTVNSIPIQDLDQRTRFQNTIDVQGRSCDMLLSHVCASDVRE